MWECMYTYMYSCKGHKVSLFDVLLPEPEAHGSFFFKAGIQQASVLLYLPPRMGLRIPACYVGAGIRAPVLSVCVARAFNHCNISPDPPWLF